MSIVNLLINVKGYLEEQKDSENAEHLLKEINSFLEKYKSNTIVATEWHKEKVNDYMSLTDIAFIQLVSELITVRDMNEKNELFDDIFEKIKNECGL